MNIESVATKELEVIDLNVFLSSLWRGRLHLLVSMLLVALVFCAVSFLMAPVYRSSVVVIPVSSEQGSGLSAALGQLGGLASIAGIDVGSLKAGGPEEALAVLRSHQFIDAFVRDNRLMPEFFPKAWDAKRGDWVAGLRYPPTSAKAYKYFRDRVSSVAQDKKSGLVTLTVDWKDRKKAADWANQLIDRINTEMRSRALEKAEKSLSYLQKELLVTADLATREAINRLIEAQVKQRMLANTTPDYAFRVVDVATQADIDDPLKPKKALLTVIGGVIGLFLGAAFILVRQLFAIAKQHRLHGELGHE